VVLLKIVGAVVALGVGLYLGLAGQYRPDPQDLDDALGPGGRTRKVKRRFTIFGWMRMPEERSSHQRRRRSSGRHFDLVSPKRTDRNK